MKQKREKEHPASWREQIRQAVTEMDVPAYAFMDVPRIEREGFLAVDIPDMNAGATRLFAAKDMPSAVRGLLAV